MTPIRHKWKKKTLEMPIPAIHGSIKANNKYMQNDNKDKNSSYLMHWHANNLYGWVTSQKLSANNFILEKNT